MSFDRLEYLFIQRAYAEKSMVSAKVSPHIKLFISLQAEADREISQIMGA